MRSLLIFIILILDCGISLHAQLDVVILDRESDEAIPGANVCLESMDGQEKHYMISGEDGGIRYKLEKRSLLSISFIGYATLLDTISPGTTGIIYLDPEFYEMDELVVTAQYSPVLADRSIYKVRVINNSIVEEKGATNLSDLISNELNFAKVLDGALGSSIRIQGLGGEHVKVLIDGVPVIGRQNGILDLSQINVSSIDHVEIVEGPMSVVYGSNAMAGIINIITRENKRESISARAEGYYESVGVYDFDAGFTLKKKKNGLGINAGRYFFDGFSEQETGRAMEWDPKLQYTLDGYYSYTGDRSRLKWSASWFSEELRDLGNVISNPFFVGAYDYYHFTRRWDTKLGYNKALGEKQNLDLTAAYSSYSKSRIKYMNDLVLLEKSVVPDPTVNDTTRFANIFSRGTYSNEKYRYLNFQTGYEFVYETAESQRLDDIKEMGEIAAFFSMAIKPLKNLEFQPGVRYIRNFHYDAPLTYSIHSRWEPVPVLQLRASYAKSFRAPSIKELYLDFQDINHNVRGNPDLMAETGQNLNFWIDLSLWEQKRNSAQLSGNIFHNKIQDKIELLFDPDDPTAAVYFNVPAGAVISRGFSSKINYNMHPRLTVNAGIFHNAISSIANTEEFTTATDLTSSLKYKNLKYRFEISLFYKYTDQYVRYTGSIDMDTGELMEVNTSSMDAYHNLDATLSLPLFDSRLILTTGAKNLFDNTSIASSGGGAVHSGGSSGMSLVNWGRTWFIKCSYHFNRFLK